MLYKESTHKPRTTAISQQEQLLHFCDEFTEFNDYCAFFCESVGLMASYSDFIDKEASKGVKRYAQSLKDKSQTLHSALQSIQSLSKPLPE